jgi:hypothetical protein
MTWWQIFDDKDFSLFRFTKNIEKEGKRKTENQI